MAVKIQLRRGTAAEWTSANPTLLSGEQGLETDTGKTKIGDGVTAWNSLGYAFVQNALISASKGALITSTGSAVAALSVGTNGHVLTADSAATNGIKWAAAAGGKVLQVVRVTDTTQRTTTSSTFVDATGLSVTITPTSASSNILLIASVAVLLNGTNQVNLYGGVAITDSSNNAISGAEGGSVVGISTSSTQPSYLVTLMAYDSPNTTSAKTYKVRFKKSTSSTVTVRLDNDLQTGQLYAIEVGA